MCVSIKSIELIPDLLAIHASYPVAFPVLLESSDDTSKLLGRYDILMGNPQQVIQSGEEDFLTAFEEAYNKEIIEPVERSLPFTGGWFVYLGYELAKEIEPTLNLPKSPTDLPDALAIRLPNAVIIDRVEQQAYLVSEEGHEAFFNDIDLQATMPEQPRVSFDIESDPEEHHQASVKTIKNYIRDGDIFQANLSRAWYARLSAEVPAYELYRRLRKTNPAPFSGLFVHDGAAVISSSPERLIEKNKRGWVSTRPIAGTRKRGATIEDNENLKKELIEHPKERAEHIMLIDLERNDLGRVCEPGTVEVDELMVLEEYAFVNHIVSNVKGKVRHNISPSNLIRAVFPGGTITGCPKVRCMEILAELERVGRGPYTGSFGYINRDGSMDLNILIRTMLYEKNQVILRAGGGIVYDSDADKERLETEDKIKGLLAALEGDE